MVCHRKRLVLERLPFCRRGLASGRHPLIITGRPPIEHWTIIKALPPNSNNGSPHAKFRLQILNLRSGSHLEISNWSVPLMIFRFSARKSQRTALAIPLCFQTSLRGLPGTGSMKRACGVQGQCRKLRTHQHQQKARAKWKRKTSTRRTRRGQCSRTTWIFWCRCVTWPATYTLLAIFCLWCTRGCSSRRSSGGQKERTRRNNSLKLGLLCLL